MTREAAVVTPGTATAGEMTCQRCGRPNVWAWHAPSPLWNAVMRSRTTGEDRYGIVCPVCFSQLVEEAGIGRELDGKARLVWCLRPDNLDVSPLWADPDGRTWDPAQCLWVDALIDESVAGEKP